MKEKFKITKWEWALILICGICIAGALGMLIYSSVFTDDQAHPEIVYDEELIYFNHEWRLSGDDEETISLPYITKAEKRSPIAVSKTLPQSLLGGTYLRFRTDNAFARVYIDSQLIYSSAGFATKGGVIAPEKWNFIPLSPEYSGRLITVSFTSSYGYYQGVVPEMILGTLPEVMLYAVSSSGIVIYLGICIMALGLIMLFLTVVNTFADASLRSYTYLGLYIIFLGLMMLTRAQYPRSYESAYYSDYLLFHLALRICPILHSLHLYARTKNDDKKEIRLLVIICSLHFVSSGILNFAGWYNFTQSLWVAILLLIIPNLIILYSAGSEQSMGSKRCRRVISVGIVTFLLGLFLEIFFRISYYANGQKTVLIVCMLIFAACQSIAVILYSYDLAWEQIAVSKELDEKRMKLMMSQMRPHFIYNALNTIREMTLIKPQKAYDLIYHFSNYLKHNIAALNDRDIIPFTQEIEHIKAYTAIECERFPNKLSVEYDIRTVNFLVPPLTVEPFVENAIKHGIRQRITKGTVRVSTEMKKHHFIVKVVDDGAGFDTAILNDDRDGEGIGIRNASFRLRELVGAHVSIKSSIGCGCSVTIIIPKVLSEGDMQ